MSSGRCARPPTGGGSRVSGRRCSSDALGGRDEVEIVALDGEPGAEVVVVRDSRGAERRVPLAAGSRGAAGVSLVTHQEWSMVSSAEILTAIRELTNTKQLERPSCTACCQDGIFAALAKKHGPTVQAEVEIDEGTGDIRIVLLQDGRRRRSPTRAARSRSRRRKFYDESFELGDVMEDAGRLRRVRPHRRAGREAAHHPARSRGRAHARSATSSRRASAICSPARCSRSSAASSSSC